MTPAERRRAKLLARSAQLDAGASTIGGRDPIVRPVTEQIKEEEPIITEANNSELDIKEKARP